jgi:hypothetical protein
MERFRWLVRNLSQTIVSLGAGVVGTIVVKAWLSGAVLWGETLFYLLLIMLLLLTMKTLLTIRDDIAREVDRSRITVSFHYKIAKQEGDSEIYEPMIRRIAAAKRSVRIMGSYRLPTVEESEGRKRYYKKIDEVLKNKIDKNEDFLYERIIQISGS